MRRKDPATSIAPEHEPSTYATTWTRGADGSFNDLKKEKAALELAGGKTLTEVAGRVGVTAHTMAAWAKHPDMRERKKALRATPAVSQTFVVSIAMICADLYTNSTKAREALDFKSSTDALVNLYKIAKAEKSLLETFDAKASSKSTDVVAALQAHLSKAQAIAEAEGEEV